MRHALALLVTLIGVLSVGEAGAAPRAKKAAASKKAKKAPAAPPRPKALPRNDPRVQAIFGSGGVSQAMGDVLKPQPPDPAEGTAAASPNASTAAATAADGTKTP